LAVPSKENARVGRLVSFAPSPRRSSIRHRAHHDSRNLGEEGTHQYVRRNEKTSGTVLPEWTVLVALLSLLVYLGRYAYPGSREGKGCCVYHQKDGTVPNRIRRDRICPLPFHRSQRPFEGYQSNAAFTVAEQNIASPRLMETYSPEVPGESCLRNCERR